MSEKKSTGKENQELFADPPAEETTEAPQEAQAAETADAGETAAAAEPAAVGSGESAVQKDSSVKEARFAPLSQGGPAAPQGSMDMLLDVGLDLSVELGRTAIPVREILQLGPGSIIELEKLAGEPVDIMINGKLIARGEVVVVDENFGVRVTEIASPTERLNQLA